MNEKLVITMKSRLFSAIVYLVHIWTALVQNQMGDVEAAHSCGSSILHFHLNFIASTRINSEYGYQRMNCKFYTDCKFMYNFIFAGKQKYELHSPKKNRAQIRSICQGYLVYL